MSSGRSDVLRPGASGRTLAGVLYYSHELRRRLRQELPHVSRDDLRRIVNALHDLQWEVLLRGEWAKLGAIGRVHLCVREPYVGSHPVTGEPLLIPQLVDLRGTCTPTLKRAFYEHNGLRYPEEPEELEELEELDQEQAGELELDRLWELERDY